MVMERILAAIDARDGAAFAAHLTSDCDFRAPGFEATGPTPAWTWMKAFLDAFPDIQHRVVASVATPSREAVEVSITGTHTAPLVAANGEIAPTGRAMTIDACDMLETDRDGLIRSYHIYFDQAGFLAQLGIGG